MAEDSQKETHYVLVIHGTWNPPSKGKVLWHQSGGTFCEKLNEHLNAHDLESPTWRPLPGKSNCLKFSWSGSNDHIHRLEAARRLCNLIKVIISKDPSSRIHLIGHSCTAPLKFGQVVSCF
jgi:hypothetical protein